MIKESIILQQLQIIKQLADDSERRNMLRMIGVVDSQIQDLLIEVMKNEN